MVSAPFPVHYFTPRAFQEINMCLVCSREKRFIKEKPTRGYLSDEFGIDSFSAGILMMYFNIVVMLNISFIPTIEFHYSTGDPLLIMPSPMSWQLSFLGCCPVAGEPSEH
jgi:hypothetical protein